MQIRLDKKYRGVMILLFFVGLLPDVAAARGEEPLQEDNAPTLGDDEATSGDEELARDGNQLDHLILGYPRLELALLDGGTIMRSTYVQGLYVNENGRKNAQYFRIDDQLKKKAVSVSCAGDPPIEQLAELSLNGCHHLQCITLPQVKVMGRISLQNTPLKDISGLPRLTKLSALDIRDAASLENISGLNALTQIDVVFLRNNPKLKHITGLHALRKIRYLNIEQIKHPAEIMLIKPISLQLRLLLAGYLYYITSSRYFVQEVLEMILSYARPAQRLIDIAVSIGKNSKESVFIQNKIVLLHKDGLFDALSDDTSSS